MIVLRVTRGSYRGTKMTVVGGDIWEDSDVCSIAFIDARTVWECVGNEEARFEDQTIRLMRRRH
jgi:hypothetical protein